MLDANYSPLHVHCAQGSFLDSTNMPKTIVKRCKELGITSCALTDHGYTTALLDFYNECNKEGVKPLLGVEAYLTPDVAIKDKTSRYDHLILLARNNQGYKNILELSSKGFIEGRYYKPRIDYKMLGQYSEGVIASSACLGGTLAKMIMDKESDDIVKEQIKKFCNIFEYFYLEIQSAINPEQEYVNKELVRFSKELNVPLVVTTDAHFIEQSDFESHGCFIKLNQLRDNEFYKDCWIKSVDEIIEVLKDQGLEEDDINSAIENTNKIAEMCNVEIEQGHSYLPDFPVPKEYENDVKYIQHLINKGFVSRGLNKKPNVKEYMDRVLMEFDVIYRKGYIGYFLITGDFLEECRQADIPTGDGRGSAAGSLICYCMGITNVDPIAADLDFSRFLTMERTSLPDIDNDVSSARKPDAITILRKKYGYDKVAQVATFLRMQGKSTIGKVAKVYDIPYSEVEKMKSKIGDKETIMEALANENGLEAYQVKYPLFFEMCMKLEGLPVGISTHAGGVVICPSNMRMSDFTGLCLNKDDEIITQGEMHNVEGEGLVKIDILATVVLDTIANALDLIYEGGIR